MLRWRTTAIRLIILLAIIGLATPAPSAANNEHPGAPCWSNGLGEGYNDNALLHPYIHFTGDVGNCGNLTGEMGVSAWRCGPAGCVRARVQHCGLAFHCHFDWGTGAVKPHHNAECYWRAGVANPPKFEHHWHYHHYYPCTTIS